MSSTNWLSEDEQRLWRAFISASSGLTTNLDASLKKSNDLGVDDYEVLVHLSEADDHKLRMSDLSTHVLHSRSRLTQRVDRLESRGFVEREKCEKDARGTWAVLTSSGMEALEEAAPNHLADVREFLFDHIDQKDIAPMVRALEAVALSMRP